MATVLVCGSAVTAGVSGLFMKEYRSRRLNQVRALTVPCSSRSTRLSQEVPDKPPRTFPLEAGSSFHSMRKGGSSCPPVPHTEAEIQALLAPSSTEEPDPDTNQRHEIDIDRIPFSNLKVDHSSARTHAMHQAAYFPLTSGVMDEDAGASRRQYSRTPSPPRHHASFDETDSCAYMHAMQQAAFFPVGSDGMMETGFHADPTQFHHMVADYSPAYAHAMHQVSFFPVDSPGTLSPLSSNYSPTHGFMAPAPFAMLQPAINSTPSPSDMAQDYCQLADFIAPCALPTVELPTMVVPCSPDEDFTFWEPGSVPEFMPRGMLPTAKVLSCPDRGFASETSREQALMPLDDFLAPAPQRSVLLRNLPAGFTRSKLMNVLHGQGLALFVDFAYVPGNLKLNQNCGYAFVNFKSSETAEQCLEKLDGFSDWGVQNSEIVCVCEASWCSDRQGLHAHVEHYKNSRIMHASVDDEYKPAVFKNGSRVPFPPPSRIIRAPRLRKA